MEEVDGDISSYSKLKVGRLEVDCWKNDIDPAVMMLFTRAEKLVTQIPLERWVAEGGDAEDWSESICEVKYSCMVSDMRHRLELRGYT